MELKLNHVESVMFAVAVHGVRAFPSDDRAEGFVVSEFSDSAGCKLKLYLSPADALALMNKLGEAMPPDVCL